MTQLERDKYLGKKVGSNADSSRDNPDNYYTCDRCQQSVYMGDLAEVFYHEDTAHTKPMLDG